MANYVYNSVGSATINSNPTKFAVGDTLTFNITNSNTTTKYKGTILSYTFPHACKVKIQAKGARGGLGTTAGKTGQLYGYGATVTATFDFNEGDQLLILVGQAGTNSGDKSTSDRTTGAGGGATYIVIKDDNGSYTFTGSTDSNSDSYNGWKVTPLIIAAGGNGGRDIAYSGTGTIYNGLGFTDGTSEALGTTSTASTQLVGGAFSKETGTNSSNSSSYRYGRCFLNGGLGSMYNYTRKATSYAGFGGGAANADDGDGGGGGGWVSGYKSASAKSYCAPTTMCTDRSSSGGSNDGEGIVVFTILEILSKFEGKVYLDNIYLESSGTQYIDTGLVATNNTKISITFERQGIDGCLIATDTAWCNTGFGIWSHAGEYGNTCITSISLSDNIKHTVVNDKGKFYIDGSLYTTLTANTFSTAQNLYLFALNRAGSIIENYTGKFYSCQIYDNDVLVRDFVPTLDRSNVACLLDKVNNTYYYNQGSGDFTYHGGVSLYDIDIIYTNIGGTWKEFDSLYSCITDDSDNTSWKE